MFHKLSLCKNISLATNQIVLNRIIWEKCFQDFICIYKNATCTIPALGIKMYTVYKLYVLKMSTLCKTLVHLDTVLNIENSLAASF